MSEKEARALGAGGSITVEDKEYILRPIAVQHLCDLEREALEYYKRQYLKTFSDNRDLLGDEFGKLIVEETRTAARWELDDLPKKKVHDVSRIPITPELKKWAEEFQAEVDGKEEELTEAKIRAMLSTALDQEKMKVEKIKEMTGKKPIEGRARYDQWWVTGAMEGMVSFLFNSIRYEHKDVTRDEVRAWPISSIFEGAKKVEEITAPTIKNG
jgi:hypothetical protein